MAVRLLRTADRTAAKALDDAVLDELTADFGPVPPMTLAKYATYIADADKRAIAYLSGGVLRGVLLAANTALPLATGTWEITRVVTQKSLTDAQRITGFRDMVAFVAASFPSITITGIVKAGGKLDTFLTPKGYARTPVVTYPGVSTIVTDPDTGISTGEQARIEYLVRHTALASVVAATI